MGITNVMQMTYGDFGLELRRASREILARFNRLPQSGENALPVGASEHGPRAKQRQGVVLSTGIVDGDVPQHVLSNLLRQVDVDPEEIS